MNEEFYISLIYKRLSMEINPSENQQLEAWLNTSDANQLMAERIERAWKESAQLGANIEVDLEAAFGELELLMEQPQGVAKPEPKVIRIEKRQPNFVKWLSIAATLLILISGGIWLSNASDNETVKDFTYTDLSTTDSKKEITLKDNSKIYLNKNSKLEYPEQFSNKERRVKLNGEAYFEVASNKNKPFIIETASEQIKVLGTTFNIKNTTKETIVTVTEGRVQLSFQSGKQRVDLIANDIGIANYEKQEIKKMKASSMNDIAWHTKTFNFEETSLSEIIERLSNAFEADIQIVNEVLKDCTYTGNFKQEALDDVLNVVSTVLSFTVEKDQQGNYILKGEGNCE